jgi:hypothetical protein
MMLGAGIPGLRFDTISLRDDRLAAKQAASERLASLPPARYPIYAAENTDTRRST